MLASSSRDAGFSFFESLIRAIHGSARLKVGGKTTAAATTGPAKAPRPTSSTPATKGEELRECSSSYVQSGRDRAFRVLLAAG